MYDLYTGPRGRKYYLERFILPFPPHLCVPQDLVRLPQVSCVNITTLEGTVVLCEQWHLLTLTKALPRKPPQRQHGSRKCSAHALLHPRPHGVHLPARVEGRHPDV